MEPTPWPADLDAGRPIENRVDIAGSGTAVVHERTSSMNRQQRGGNLMETAAWCTRRLVRRRHRTSVYAGRLYLAEGLSLS
jgi:hypothetical protein